MILDEQARSYIDDPRYVELLRFITWKGQDVAPTWIGKYAPATRSDDADLAEMAKFNMDHYLFYQFFVEKYVEPDRYALDVGCGSGHRTAMLSRYCREVVGIDSDRIKVDFAAAFNFSGNIAYYQAQFPHMTVSRPMDYIFIVEVIEHVELAKHDEMIDMAMALLGDGGKLFLTTPKDKAVVRKSPHIGLWSPDDFERQKYRLDVVDFGYLKAGSSAKCMDPELATAYFLVLEKK